MTVEEPKPQFYKVRKNGKWWSLGSFTRANATFTLNEREAGHWKTLEGARSAVAKSEDNRQRQRTSRGRAAAQVGRYEIIATYWNPYRQEVVERIEENPQDSHYQPGTLVPCIYCWAMGPRQPAECPHEAEQQRTLESYTRVRKLKSMG